ncbi:MAG: hypothetical protein ACI9UK_000325 [Candidatus Krumholzibacteriia bacterium]|jgi:uncharacterized protein YbbC (DUF1343 family)
MAIVKIGLEVLENNGFKGIIDARVGLLVHPASVDSEWRPTRHLLAKAGVNVCALFGPQHGILGQTQDNMIEWEGYRDPDTGIPVYSLYGEHRKPAPHMLENIDVLVIDLQDIGARYYTFIWTMLLCLEACAESGTKVVILDRPNPIGGLRTEGTVLDENYCSFVGLAAIPMRHAMTIGELADLFAKTRQLDVEYEVISMTGWRREMSFADTGLPWVMPSPNMPTLDTAWVYPGGCLLEGTTLSEGRGTTRPFEIFGAPYVEPDKFVAKLNDFGFEGCYLRPLHFEPTFHKHAGKVCGGVQVHVTDPTIFESVNLYSTAIAVINEYWPAEFGWKQPPYEYESVKLPIDILSGGVKWRALVEGGATPEQMKTQWSAPLAEFDDLAGGFLRYG